MYHFGKVVYTLLDSKWITNKDLLYSTWNSIQCYVPAWMRGGFENEYVYVYGWVPSLLTWNYHNIVNQLSVSSVQSLSCVRLFVTPRMAAHQASLSITNSQSSLKFMSIELVMPSSHLILCHPLLLLPQSLPASGSFPMSQLFAWGGQSTGVSASASVLPKKSQGWSAFGWTGWISLQAEGLSRVFSNTTVQKHQFFGTQLSSQSIHDHFSHPYMTTGKTIALTRQTFVGKVISLLFNILSRLVITFLPRSKRLLISWLQSPSAVIFFSFSFSFLFFFFF